jgi:hypothetical protein
MEGSERMTAKTGKAEIAQWVKDAVGKMDALLDEKTRSEIMTNCGFNCAEVNKRVIEKAKARRRKFRALTSFLRLKYRNPCGERSASEKETCCISTMCRRLMRSL